MALQFLVSFEGGEVQLTLNLDRGPTILMITPLMLLMVLRLVVQHMAPLPLCLVGLFAVTGLRGFMLLDIQLLT
jgi:hypothetical protein